MNNGPLTANLLCIYCISIAHLAPKLRSVFPAKYLQLRTEASNVNSVVMLLPTPIKQCLHPSCTPRQLCASCSDPVAPQKTIRRDTDFALAARFGLAASIQGSQPNSQQNSTPRTDSQTHAHTRDETAIALRRNAFRHEAYCNKIKCQYKRGIKQTRLTMPGLRRLRRAADVLLSRGRSQ